MKTLVALLVGVVIGVAATRVQSSIAASSPAPDAAAASTPAVASASGSTPARNGRGAAGRGGAGGAVDQPSVIVADHLTKSPRHQEWITVEQGDRKIRCFVVYPDSKEKASAVIVIHENTGLIKWAQSVADQLAEHGYIAIAPDLLSGTGPNGGNTDSFAPGTATSGINALPAQQITDDLNAVAAYISKQPSSNGNFSVVGFCWGGGQSFRFATNNKNLKAAFVFYGAPPPAAEMAKIVCPVYGFYGETDGRLTLGDPQTITNMKTAGKAYDSVVYAGAPHAFMRLGQIDNANPVIKKASEDAWKRFLDLLGKVNAPVDAKPATEAKPATTGAAK